MFQLDLFNQDLVEKIRKQVLKEFKRIDGEDWDEYLEVVRYEVDARLADCVKISRSYHLQPSKKNNNIK